MKWLAGWAGLPRAKGGLGRPDGQGSQGWLARLRCWFAPESPPPAGRKEGLPLLQVPRPLCLGEGQLVDLGAFWDQPLFRGLLLLGTLEGAQLQQIPEGFSLWALGALEVGATLPFGQVAWLRGPGGLLTNLVVVRPRQASPALWGKAWCLLEGHLIGFDLGGLEPFDLGVRLNLPALTGLVLALSKGGLRVLALPEALTLEGTAGQTLPGRIPFGLPVRLRYDGERLGELVFMAFEGVPEPSAFLCYLGALPERRRKRFLLMEEADLGLVTLDAHLHRLCLRPCSEGVVLAHLPGHLCLFGEQGPLFPERLLPFGGSVAFWEVDSKACVGLLDVLEP